MKTTVLYGLTLLLILISSNTQSQERVDWNDDGQLWVAAKNIFNSEHAGDDAYAEAVSYVKRALELKPDNCKYKFGLGLLNYKLENWNIAEIWFEQVAYTTSDLCKDYPVEYMLGKTREKIILASAVNTDGSSGLLRTFSFKDSRAFTMVDYKNVVPKLNFNHTDYPTLADYIMAKKPGLKRLDRVGFVILEPREDKLKKHADNISRAGTFLQQRYGFTIFNKQVTFVLSDNPDDLLILARRLYPMERFPVHNPYFGFYSEKDDLLMATSYGGYGTVFHEMVHVSFAHSFPDAPLWLEEGMATLYERANWVDGKLVPLPNWRMNFILNKPVVPLSKLPSLIQKNISDTDNPDEMNLSGYINNEYLERNDLAEIRLFFLFLDKEGVLNELYWQVKADKDDFRLADFINQLEIENINQKWTQFVNRTVEHYKIELEMAKTTIPYREVMFIQQALNKLNNEQLKEDGYWGEYTENALKRFQQQHGLDPTGEYNKATKNTLHAVFEKLTIKLE